MRNRSEIFHSAEARDSTPVPPASMAAAGTADTVNLSMLLSLPPLLLLLLLPLLQPTAAIRPAGLPGGLGGDRPAGAGAVYPPTCGRIECPGFDVVEKGNGYEVRQYNSTAWASTAPIEDISFVEGTRAGFLQLFNYIQGKNKYGEKIEMTAPVLTQVSPSDGPFCASSFVVSFYVPKKNQADPPPADGIHIQKWGVKYAAIRQFGGFVSDSNVGQEAAALYASLADSKWSSAVDKGQSAGPLVYTVAQYNSPFEFSGRVNEIWMFLDIEPYSSI